MRTVLLGLALLGSLTAVRGAPGPDPAASSPAPSAFALRREYNEVTAAIDTLVRLYTAPRLSRLADPLSTPGAGLPEGTRLVLLFWADDEARVYLNGAPIAQTRLTPTRVEIPPIYLESDNELVAQCWDTDQVESGFMAGLYLEEASGGLRPVLATTEGFGWRTGAGAAAPLAQEIYYSHTRPDLPGAEVVWGPQLFGQVELHVRFRAADVTRAARRPAAGAAPSTVRDGAMELHQVVARLVGLQQRREELAARLASGARGGEPAIRFVGAKAATGLAHTLGSAGPLQEAVDERTTTRLEEWMRQLPDAQRQLVLHDARRLRGPGALTPAAPLPLAPAEGAAAGAPDRRADYRPPDDRGTAGQGQGISATPGAGRIVRVRALSSASLPPLALLAAILALWSATAGWRGWLLWRGVSWTGPRP